MLPEPILLVNQGTAAFARISSVTDRKSSRPFTILDKLPSLKSCFVVAGTNYSFPGTRRLFAPPPPSTAPGLCQAARFALSPDGSPHLSSLCRTHMHMFRGRGGNTFPHQRPSEATPTEAFSFCGLRPG